jgi:hypothetical protein
MSRTHLNTGSMIGAVLAIAGVATIVFGSVAIGLAAAGAGLITVAGSEFVHRGSANRAMR